MRLPACKCIKAALASGYEAARLSNRQEVAWLQAVMMLGDIWQVPDLRLLNDHFHVTEHE